ncbi:MAG: DUF2844 domain-containing protein [Comamonadaceae bacterium]
MQQFFRTDGFRATLLSLALVMSLDDSMATLGREPSMSRAAETSTAPVARKLAAASNTSSSLYTFHETQLESGTTVREFATPAGVVFAVTWRGPVLPDLGALLGDYFNTFKAETDQARAMGKRGSPVNIERSDLVVNSSGRMRNFFGYAYAPALIPTGVNVKDVLQ